MISRMLLRVVELVYLSRLVMAGANSTHICSVHSCPHGVRLLESRPVSLYTIPTNLVARLVVLQASVEGTYAVSFPCRAVIFCTVIRAVQLVSTSATYGARVAR
jgi:hypothetical protein